MLSWDIMDGWTDRQTNRFDGQTVDFNILMCDKNRVYCDMQ